MAPESYLDGVWNVRTDVWSFAVLLWGTLRRMVQVLTNSKPDSPTALRTNALLSLVEIYANCTTPWGNLMDSAILPSIQQRHKLPQPDNCSNEIYALMTQCWRLDAASRPTAADIKIQLTTILGDELVQHSELAWPRAAALQKQASLTSTLESDHLDPTIDTQSNKALAYFDSLAIDRSKLTVDKLLGSGAFGEVWMGSLRLQNPSIARKVAIKTLKNSGDTELKQQFLMEARMLAAMRHPHILRLVGACAHDEPFYMILEYMPLGDLQQYLRMQSTLLLPKQLMSSLHQVADAMTYLEKSHVIHRDLAAR
jgi:serine/threonine protein kinase